jgi:hypothetical protein
MVLYAHDHAQPTTSLLPDSTLVECQLVTLQHIPIHTSTLSRPRRNHCIQSPSLELSLQSRLHLSSSSEPRCLLVLHALALLFLCSLSTRFLLSSPAQRLTVVSFVPLSERSSVDLDDGGFGEGVCADEFVVRRMEGDDDDTDFASDSFRAPGEVAGFETEGTVFLVSTSRAD